MTVLLPFPMDEPGGRFAPSEGNVLTYAFALWFSYTAFLSYIGMILLAGSDDWVHWIAAVFTISASAAAAMAASVYMANQREDLYYPAKYEPFELNTKTVLNFVVAAISIAIVVFLSGIMFGATIVYFVWMMGFVHTIDAAYLLLFFGAILGSSLWVRLFEFQLRKRLKIIHGSLDALNVAASVNSYEEFEDFVPFKKKYSYNWNDEVPPRTCGECGSVYGVELPECPICGTINDLQESYMKSKQMASADGEDTLEAQTSSSTEGEIMPAVSGIVEETTLGASDKEEE